MSRLKFIIPITIFILFISFILACNGKSENPEKVGEAETKELASTDTLLTATDKTKSENQIEQTLETEPIQQYFEIGDKVDLNGTVITVKEVKKSPGNDFDKPKDGMEYVIVTINIQNNSDDKISYNPFDFKIQNSDGQITDMAFSIVDTDTSLESGELAIGGQVEGTVAFEEPKDDPGLILIYQSSFWDDNKVIKIQLN